MSTWEEIDYWTEMTTGWYVTFYYQMIICLVGFIVSQLFIAVVCFGFDTLEKQINEPIFSDAVIGKPYVEKPIEAEDMLCICLNKPVNPLNGAKEVEMDRGERNGIRVEVKFLYHHYPPPKLDVKGCYEVKECIDTLANPCFDRNYQPDGVGIKPDEPATGDLEPATGDETETVPLGNALSVQLCSAEERYTHYRQVMAEWKADAAAKQEAEANGPFKLAAGSAKPREKRFEYKALTTWSNERVFSLYTMLRAQEQMDTTNTLIFYHDNDGAPGKEMENEMLSDLLTVSDDEVMPELVVHVRSYIKVLVEPLSIPNCQLPDFSVVGSETIGELKEMCFGYIQLQGVIPATVTLDDCKMWVGGDVLVDDECSLFKVCLDAYDGDDYEPAVNSQIFDPMLNPIFFALTIDESEKFILSTTFDNTIIGIICLNSITLSIDHYGASDDFKTMLGIAEWIFNVVFTLEMFLKFYCLKGFCNYWRFGSNQFDFVIVCSSWLNILTESVGLDLAFMKVLRIFRVMRVTRVLRKIKSVRELLNAAFNSVQPIMNIMMFMLVVLIVYSCMGMQLYGAQFNFEEDDEYPPRENFDNIVMSFLTLFQVLHIVVNACCEWTLGGSGADWQCMGASAVRLHAGQEELSSWGSIHSFFLCALQLYHLERCYWSNFNQHEHRH